MQTVDFHSRLLLFHSELSDGNVDARFSTPKEIRNNRQNIFAPHELNFREAIETAQIHSDRILVLNGDNTKMWRGVNVTGVDGLLTNQTDAIMMIRVADCVPLVFYDPDNHAAGIFHAGWQGLVKGIHLAGLKRFETAYKSNPKSMLVWIGPCARSCHYQAKDLPTQAEDPARKPLIKKTGTSYALDLVGFLVEGLKTAGVLKSHIVDSGLCTIETANLFSHQRSQATGEANGRFAVVLKLK